MTPLPPMRPMKPMEPMNPMEPMSFGEAWWPKDLGQPSTSGAQNDMRYAVFPQARRLLIEAEGRLTTYDTADHRIGGVSQQNSGRRSLAFTSQHGSVRLDDLAVIEGSHRGQHTTGSTGDDARSARHERSPASSETMAANGAETAHPAGERVVYSEESGAGGRVKLIVGGALDEDVIEALEDFLRRQRRRLERLTADRPDPTVSSKQG